MMRYIRSKIPTETNEEILEMDDFSNELANKVEFLTMHFDIKCFLCRSQLIFRNTHVNSGLCFLCTYCSEILTI